MLRAGRLHADQLGLALREPLLELRDPAAERIGRPDELEEGALPVLQHRFDRLQPLVRVRSVGKHDLHRRGRLGRRGRGIAERVRLLGDRLGEREPGDVAREDEDLAQPATALPLLGEGGVEALTGDLAPVDEDLSDRAPACGDRLHLLRIGIGSRRAEPFRPLSSPALGEERPNLYIRSEEVGIVGRGLIACASAVAVLALAGAGRAGPAAIAVGNESQFAAAVAALRNSSGTIALRPRQYRELVVGARSGGQLRVVGAPGVRVERFLLDHTQHVSLERVAIVPSRDDASLEVRASRDVDLDRLLVTARGTPYSASVSVPWSNGVTIRRSTFTHCGDRSPDWSFCVLLNFGANHLLLEDNWFHDCFGCDFVHGRFGSVLTIRRNRFERALPCRMNRVRCGHQDLIELFSGRYLRIEDNRFGVYREGGAQVYFTNDTDHVEVVNNLFVGTDPRVPGYRARVALVIGSRESKRLPRYVKVANNTILTGFRRRDGYAGSIRMSSLYGAVAPRLRPLIVNNVIALLRDTWPVCAAVRASISNVVVDGTACSASDRVGDPLLDDHHRPTADSTLLLDRANRRYAPRRDITGRRRGASPDIGAYELPS